MTLGSDNDQAHDPETGAGVWSSQVVAGGDRYLRRPTHRPDQVLVMGDRTVFDAAVDWLTPVLYYQEIPPDGSRPPAPVVLEVSPDNLAALAGKPTVSEFAAEKNSARAMLDAIGFVPPKAPDGTEGPPPPALYAMVWQRLMLVQDEETWARTIPGLPEQARVLLKEQLGRVYQVPRELRRLLPIDDRASRDYRGRRLPPTVEAFGYRAVRGLVTKAPVAPGPDAQERKDLLEELEAVRAQIEEERKRIKMLTGPTANELMVAQEEHNNAILAGNFSVAEYATRQTLARVSQGLERIGQFVGADPGTGYAIFSPFDIAAIREAGKPGSEVLQRASDARDRFYNEWIRKVGLENVLGLSPEALDQTGRDAAVKVAEDAIDRHEARARDLERRLNPKLQKQNELSEVEAEIARVMAKDGREPAALRLRAKVLQREIDKLIEKEIEAKQADPPNLETLFHVNTGRAPVPYQVLDYELGVIRISGPLPVWLANRHVTNVADTFAMFMPVKITFGTANGADVDTSEKRPITGVDLTRPNSFYLDSVAAALAATPDIAPLVGLLGHVIPAAEGERRFEVGFSNTAGDVDRRTARRLLVPGFQEFVELYGLSNRQELRLRAFPLAEALLNAPANVPDGSLTVRGPRMVLCNGVISAVETRWQGPEGFVTEVSFHVDTEPLPGTEGLTLTGKPTRWRFGLDVDRERDW